MEMRCTSELFSQVIYFININRTENLTEDDKKSYLNELENHLKELSANELDCLLSFGDWCYLEELQMIIEHGGNPFINDGKILTIACKRGNIEIAKYLLSMGLDPNENNSVALQVACSGCPPTSIGDRRRQPRYGGGHPTRSGIESSAPSDDGGHPTRSGIESSAPSDDGGHPTRSGIESSAPPDDGGHENIISLLLDNGTKITNEVVWSVILCNNSSVINLLINRGMDPNSLLKNLLLWRCDARYSSVFSIIASEDVDFSRIFRECSAILKK